MKNIGVELNQGDDFRVVIQIKGDSIPIDITGYSFLGKMRKTTDPSSTAVASFTFSILNQVSNKGQVSMSLAASITKDIVASISDAEQRQRLTTPFVFDVKMKDTSGKISRILQGIMYLSPQATVESFT